MHDQVDGFTVETRSIPNYVTMIELDGVGTDCIRTISRRCRSGTSASQGDQGRRRLTKPRWFCAVGSKEELRLSSADEARRYLEKVCPPILEMTSEECVAAFAGRTSYHVGQSATCSQLHGGRAVLLGDAAAPFPPIGQGVNAAMESAVVLDEFLAEPDVDRATQPRGTARHGSPSPTPSPGSANGCCSIIRSTRCARQSPWPSESTWWARRRAQPCRTRRFARRPDSSGRCGRNRYLIGRFASFGGDRDEERGRRYRFRPWIEGLCGPPPDGHVCAAHLIISWSFVIPAKGG